MWHYFYAHAVYHGVRWFPEGNRWKMNLFVGLVALLLPVPQIYVMQLENSSRWCEEPLLNLATAGLVMTLFTIAFTFLFIILVPVPRGVKIFFHVVGLTDLILGFITLGYTLRAQSDCFTSTPELTLMSQISSGLSVASAVSHRAEINVTNHFIDSFNSINCLSAFLVIMFPFWVINKARPKAVLDPYSRTGVCYEPVKCCQCLWHI